MLTPTISAPPTFASESVDWDGEDDPCLDVPRSGWGFPEWFAVAQVAGPALLYLPGTQVLRAPLRTGVFALALLGIGWWLVKVRRTTVHRAWLLLIVGAAYMALMIIHPTTNTIMAGIAQLGMHLAVAAPLLWAPDYFRGDYRRATRVLTILWLLNGASVLVGLLQVRDPARWMPAEFSTVAVNRRMKIAAYSYRAGDGSMAVRPPGLGDTPGAASAAGMFVATLGLAFLGLPLSRFRKLLGILLGMAGIVIIFLSHVRSALVVVAGCAFIYSIVMVLQGRLKTVLTVALSIAVGALGGIVYAETIGGKSTMDRFATLLASDPLTVYQNSSRLDMVTEAFGSLLLDYPLGAGLGRWGMMRVYFGDESNGASPMIWSEVQFSSWILDGGIVLLSAYMIALAVTLGRLIRLTLSHPSWQLRQWGAAIVMLSAGPIAFTFSYCPFHGQMGMQFWLLIGAFEGLAQGEEADALVAYGSLVDPLSECEIPGVDDDRSDDA